MVQVRIVQGAKVADMVVLVVICWDANGKHVSDMSRALQASKLIIWCPGCRKPAFGGFRRVHAAQRPLVAKATMPTEKNDGILIEASTSARSWVWRKDTIERVGALSPSLCLLTVNCHSLSLPLSLSRQRLATTQPSRDTLRKDDALLDPQLGRAQHS